MTFHLPPIFSALTFHPMLQQGCGMGGYEDTMQEYAHVVGKGEF